MKQKLFKISFFVALNACLCSEQNGWSWNQETTQNNSTDIKESESESQIIEEILDSSRNGRALEQYDQVYSDPTIQDALQKGDDSEARNLIKDRLCSLGLMQCDENIEEKRPFIAPEELIYAQPVSINPIGRPIPTIPLNNKHYGPPKPLQYPPNKYHGPQVSKYGPQLSKYGPQGSKFGPQGPQIYGSGANKPPRRDFGLNTFGSKPFLSNGEILAEGEFLDKPPSLDLLNQPYKFENPNKNVKITVNAQGGSAVTSSNGLVEHVHHHYHHNADGSVNNNKQPSVIINPIPIAAASVSSTLENTNQFLPSRNYIGSTFNGISSSNYGGQSLSSYPTSGLSSFTSNSKPVYEQFGPQTFGSTVGQYGTSNLYKKEFNINSGNNNYLQGNYADKYHGSESARAENYDCVCVPYDQCPSSDIIGRKDDLYLAIDPRNLKSDIQAISEDEERVITDGNGTMTVVKVPIGVENGTEEVNKKISKREAPLENNFNSTDIEGRQYQGMNQYLPNMKKIKPTIGISFSLPQQSGYHINPHGDNPHVNPYGSTIGASGINLGLVSVNPLISIQLSKDDYGEKVLTPFVNFHVTPNDYLVHKFDDILHHKKHYVYNKHKHFHVHKGHHSYHRKPHIVPHIVKESVVPHFGDSTYEESPHTLYENPLLHNDVHPYLHDEPTLYNDDSLLGTDDEYGTIRSTNSNSRTGKTLSYNLVKFPTTTKRKRRDITKRQAYYGRPQTSSCGPRHVCCKRPLRPLVPQINNKQCGTRHSQGINGRIKNPVYVDGDSEFGEYPWQAAILKKDPKESVYVCGGTLVDPLHILTAAHCVKQYTNYDLRVRLGEWDVNHDVEFYPYIERDVSSLTVHPEFYAGTLYNDLAILRLDTPVDFTKNPHISPACLPYPNDDYSGTRCWTTGWGKDAFGDFGKYQNILKEVDVPVISNQVCQRQLQNTRLGYEFKLHPGFVCAGGEEGKDACKGDGGGPMVCEKGGTWQLVGIVSWGIGCGQVGVPGVYVKVAHYLDWIRQVTQRY